MVRDTIEDQLVLGNIAEEALKKINDEMVFFDSELSDSDMSFSASNTNMNKSNSKAVRPMPAHPRKAQRRVKGKRCQRLIDNDNLLCMKSLLSPIDEVFDEMDDPSQISYFQAAPPVDALSQLFENPEAMNVWYKFIELSEDEQQEVLLEKDRVHQNEGKTAEEIISCMDDLDLHAVRITIDQLPKKKLSDQERFSKIHAKTRKQLLRSGFPLKGLKTFEDKIVSLFYDQDVVSSFGKFVSTAVKKYVFKCHSPLDRLLIHACSSYHCLSSRTQQSALTVRNSNGKLVSPRLDLVRFVQKMRERNR